MRAGRGSWRQRVRLPRDHYVRVGSRVVAEHARCWARWQTTTDPHHRAAALALSHAATHRPPAPPAGEVEQRDLATYDAAFGLSEAS